jgi:transposase
MDDVGYACFVGVDWGTEAHQLCCLDVDRRVLGEMSVEHSSEALERAVQKLMGLSGGKPDRVAVAIEVPRGAVVELLVERGFHVFAINPKQLDRFRDRHTVAGAKDDRRDALVLADSLRTDRVAFRRVKLDDPLIIQIRESSRADDELVQELQRCANRLRDQLYRYYSHVLRLCPAADEPWFWDLIELAPTPVQGARMTKSAVRKFLERQRITRLTPSEMLQVLQTPAISVAPGVVEAASDHVGLLLPRLRMAHEQRRRCRRRLEALLDELAPVDGQGSVHSDVEVLRSLPGVGTKVAATLIAEVAGPLRDRDYHSLRAQAGTAPVTRSSGKRSGARAPVSMRRACNPRVREAVYHWSRVSVQTDQRSRAYYRELRGRGHSHGRALRSVGDRWLRILASMLMHGSLYDPSRHEPLSTGDVAEAGISDTPKCRPRRSPRRRATATSPVGNGTRRCKTTA